ncbi:hypothetical protein RND81_05G030000 [Saponaria officinalis]|uniref:Uncharacterized protein n=1 Tax=Saponaria officinalis TaxID=3572 RepID=A0AAW1KTY0_SAPOF
MSTLNSHRLFKSVSPALPRHTRTLNPISNHWHCCRRTINHSPAFLHLNKLYLRRRRRNPSNFSTKCSVNLPLKPSSPAGKSLSTVLQNDPHFIYDAVSCELRRLSGDRGDASLHRFVDFNFI